MDLDSDRSALARDLDAFSPVERAIRDVRHALDLPRRICCVPREHVIRDHCLAIHATNPRGERNRLTAAVSPVSVRSVRDELLRYLVCPACRSNLVRSNQSLSCERGHRYPVVSNVPSLIASQENRPINRSFSHEWAQFDYDVDRTWGLTAERRIDDFLRQLKADRNEVAGKLILDAGCGNGVVSDAVARLGATVVATDISDSVFAASRRFVANDRLQFVQSDLMHSAFKAHTFDVIYSGGVLHHTPSTQGALTEVVKSLRPGGSIFIWLYWRVPGRRYAVKSALRRVMAPLPVKAKHALIIPVVAQNALRHRGEDVSWRERMITQLDYFTPRYRWEHTPDEVHTWFRELGMSGIETTDEARDGFGVLARAPVP